MTKAEAHLVMNPPPIIDELFKAYKTHCGSLSMNTDKLEPKGFGRMLNAQIKLKGWKVRSFRSHGRTVYQGMKYKTVNEGGF